MGSGWGCLATRLYHQKCREMVYPVVSIFHPPSHTFLNFVAHKQSTPNFYYNCQSTPTCWALSYTEIGESLSCPTGRGKGKGHDQVHTTRDRVRIKIQIPSPGLFLYRLHLGAVLCITGNIPQFESLHVLIYFTLDLPVCFVAKMLWIDWLKIFASSSLGWNWHWNHTSIF